MQALAVLVPPLVVTFRVRLGCLSRSTSSTKGTPGINRSMAPRRVEDHGVWFSGGVLCPP